MMVTDDVSGQLAYAPAPDFPRCPACGHPFEFDPGQTIPYRTGGTPPAGVHLPSHVAFCRSCGLGAALPPFSEADEAVIYKQGQFWQNALPPEPRQDLRKLSLALALAESRWRFIKQHWSGKSAGSGLRLLDIGSGQGAMGLVAAKDRTTPLSEYVAVEPDGGMRAELSGFWQREGLQVPLRQTASLEELGPAAGRFDIVVLSHVLEHLRSPGELLKQVSPYLRDSGALFIEVPHQDYLFKRDIFPHLLFFSHGSLKALLLQGGWDIQSIESYGRDQAKTPFRRDSSIVLRIVIRLMGKLERHIPSGLQRAGYRWAFGIDRKNPKGTWLRALSSPKKQ
ncbi:MAG: class I SAM-dependent methyltransferase [Elusimicrobiota bacterium]|jgi:SAM-dependent methyltransferase